MQRQHIDMAARDRDLRAEVNHGRPHIAATERPTSFEGHGVVAARAAGGAYHPAVNHAPAGGHQGGEPARQGGEPAHGAAFTPRNDRPPQAQREAAAQQFAATQHAPQHNEPTHGGQPIHNESAHGSAAVHNEPARSPIAHNTETPRPHQAPQPHPGGGQPHAAAQPNSAPHGQAPHAGGHGGNEVGGGRPEGHAGHGEQNRFR